MKEFANEFLTVELYKTRTVTFFKKNDSWVLFSMNQNVELLKSMVPKYTMRNMTWKSFADRGCILSLEVFNDDKELVYEDSFDMEDTGGQVVNELDTYKEIALNILNQEKLEECRR